MKSSLLLATAILAGAVAPAMAQDANVPALGEVVVTGNRLNARYAQQDRPVIGLRRQADSAVLQVAISSESRDEADRKREIHMMVQSALDRAAAAGVEIVTGSFELFPVTKANYQDMPFVSAGRVDTSQVNFMVKAKLAGSVTAVEQRLNTFVKSIPVSGRGAVDARGAVTLTIFNPDQYREAIVKLVAENARAHAAMFGPDYAVQVNGMDGQVFWSQVSGTEVFLYMPYRYTIVPK